VDVEFVGAGLSIELCLDLFNQLLIHFEN